MSGYSFCQLSWDSCALAFFRLTDRLGIEQMSGLLWPTATIRGLVVQCAAEFLNLSKLKL